MKKMPLALSRVYHLLLLDVVVVVVAVVVVVVEEVLVRLFPIHLAFKSTFNHGKFDQESYDQLFLALPSTSDRSLFRVTRFGKISLLWQKNQSLGQFFKVFLLLGKILNLL